ncbi:MAG: TIGR03118 family protein, partial [Candidatus Sulfotelmatobacter sp.]
MKKTILLFGLLVSFAVPSALLAQSGYSQANLVSNVSGVATTTDPHLVNPWGISALPGQDFWIANNNNGTSTLYDANGNPNSLVVNIPGAGHNPNGNCTPGCPTGTVSNGTGTYFSGGSFIFDTEDGLIVNWQSSDNTQATIAFDNSASGAVYKGLALLNGTSLLAANFNSGKVDVYDQNFNPASLAGSFTDPNLPAGFAPHGIHVINGQVYVAYAMQDGPKHDAQPGAGLGQVDIFDATGKFVSTFVAYNAQTSNHLNAPWGVVQAPATFGTFANDILIGNFGDGTIDAFDTQGNFMGQIMDSSSNVLVNPGLWDMVFGGSANVGAAGTLYVTAGGSNQPNFPSGGSTTSVFASLVPAAAASSADFSLNLSAQSATVNPGGSASLMVSAAAVGGFSGQISLTCSAPAGLTCAFNPATISPGAPAATLTVSAVSTPPPTGYSMPAMLALLPGLGLFGTVLTTQKRKPLSRASVRWISLLGLLLVVSLFALGCGGSKSSTPSTATGSQATMMVTGTSGAISHT